VAFNLVERNGKGLARSMVVRVPKVTLSSENMSGTNAVTLASNRSTQHSEVTWSLV
jgi:hypothetical protein